MNIKIISWNCNMAFRKKYQKLVDLKPDLLVIQECENDTKLERYLETLDYNQLIWYGDNPHKGVAIISFNTLEIKLNKKHNPEFKYVVPVTLKVNNRSINLFCVWAMPHKIERRKDYVGQIWGAINYYEKLLKKDSILIGDFNSNTIWDKKNKVGTHTDVVDFLNQKNIQSIYHEKFRVKHGEENEPTLYLLKQKERPYHLDYCFASKNLFNKKTTFEIGKYEDWIKFSDHMPIIIDNLIV
ncbi:endonuclease/exonuclease/phosphatase family protein [Saprospiraceae bacterium]|nr:endonuclease/exonuclease/phosphatase family protein [Saprospiraceae bacterium]